MATFFSRSAPSFSSPPAVATNDDDGDDGKDAGPSTVTDAAAKADVATIQVIYTDCATADAVVADFDMTHACAYYDGSAVTASWACVWACVSRTTEPLPGIVPTQARIGKASAKGFAAAFDLAAASASGSAPAVHGAAPYNPDAK